MSKRQITKHFWANPETRQGVSRLLLPLSLLSKIERGGEATQKTGEASQWLDFKSAADEVSPLPASEILPKPEELYYLTMRAISQKVVECYSIDYTRPGVLEASVPLLNGQRICKDHEYWEVEDAIGAIVSAEWDSAGTNSNGVPGINARFFIDSKIAPGIVRRLAYPVPAIHSCSVTVGFEWEPSHLDLLEEGDFWRLLGREVEGQVVRLIVTKILFYRELSLVWAGADTDAKRIPEDDEEPAAEDAGESESKRKTKMNSASLPPVGNKEKTVKLSKDQKELLGLSHAGEDVPDAEVVNALDGLVKAQAHTQGQITAAQAIIATERAEVVRLATLVEAGDDGKLPEVIAASIEHTPADKLSALKAHYEQKAAAKLGVKNGTARSSVEDNPVTAAPQPKAQAAEVNWL